MKRKKVFIGIVWGCIVAVFLAIYSLIYGGWGWFLPQTLLNKVDFDRIKVNVDQLVADGYTDASSRKLVHGEPSVYFLGKSDNGKSTPLIIIYMENDNNGSVAADTLRYGAKTKFLCDLNSLDLNSSAGNKDRYRFRQEITIECGQNNIWITYYTKNLFSGRQQVIDFLSQFCERYCSD